MDSRRLVVWISTGILGFQGATLAFDLLNCSAMGWLYVRMNGLPAHGQRINAASANGQGNPRWPGVGGLGAGSRDRQIVSPTLSGAQDTTD